MTNNLPIKELFFYLIRVGIGTAEKMPYTPSKEEWNALYDLAKKQALHGITFAAIEKLPKEQQPDVKILLPWYKTCESIKKKNHELTRKAIIISEKFKEEGFRNCILKGQGIAQYYPNPLLRVSGDIDIWLEGDCDKIIRYIKGILPKSFAVYHHIDFSMYDDIEIEAHYRPTWLCNPIRNQTLQLFLKRESTKQFSHIICTNEGTLHTPDTVFNLIYIQMHIFRHLFDEGVGLRQVMDYYFLLQQDISKEEREECISVLKKIGQLKFTRALMYVLKEIFNIDDSLMFIEPDCRYGKFLLSEIMTAGNLGQFDTRYKQVGRGFSITRATIWIRRAVKLIIHSPNEILWDPYFRIMHHFWRMKKNKIK